MSKYCQNSYWSTFKFGFLLKFGLSEKHTKFEKIFLMIWTSKCPKHEEDCANFWVLLRKYVLIKLLFAKTGFVLDKMIIK